MRAGLLLTALVLVPAVGFADAKQEIQAIYSKMDAAFRRKDIEAMSKYWDPSFSASVNGRQVTRGQYIAYAKRLFPGVKTLDSSLKMTSFALQGKEAVTICKVERKVLVQASDKKLHRIVTKDTRQDVWEKRNEGWRIKHIQVLKEQTLMDGKPVLLPVK